MELYILRHAIAEEHDPIAYPDDALRPLTKKGIGRMKKVARGLYSLGMTFDAIISSPFARARQTAEIMADVFAAHKKLVLSPHLEVGGDPKKLIHELQTRHKSASCLLLVGHEPYLSDLVSVLLLGDSRLALTMKKGGICKLRIDDLKYGRCATLEWLLPPGISTEIKG